MAEPTSPAYPPGAILDQNGRPWRDAYDGQGWAVPHVISFGGLLGQAWRAYYHDKFDEARRHSRQDALVMENDAGLQGLLQERKLAVASLPWHLEVPNDKDPTQVEVRDALTSQIRGIKGLGQILMCLLDAIWFGRHGAQVRWKWVRSDGRRLLTVRDWRPLRGDKIGHKFDGTPYVLLYPGAANDIEAHDPTAELINTNVGGRGLVLRGWWRERFLLHRHECVDADFLDLTAAEAVHGVGVRSRIFWLDWLKREWMANITSYMEKVGLGVELWYYPAGNAAAEKRTRDAATTQEGARTRLLVPRFGGTNDSSVERIEVPMGGAEFLLKLIEHVEELQRIYVCGQTTSAGQKKTGSGLGNEADAEFQQDTKLQIRNYDAGNLAEIALTGDEDEPGLVSMMQKWSFPETVPSDRNPDGFWVRFKFSLEAQESAEKLQAVTTVVGLGLPVKADEVYETAGLTRPEEDDDVVEGQVEEEPSGASGEGKGGGGKSGGGNGNGNGNGWQPFHGPKGGHHLKGPDGQTTPMKGGRKVPFARQGAPERFGGHDVSGEARIPAGQQGGGEWTEGGGGEAGKSSNLPGGAEIRPHEWGVGLFVPGKRKPILMAEDRNGLLHMAAKMDTPAYGRGLEALIAHHTADVTGRKKKGETFNVGGKELSRQEFIKAQQDHLAKGEDAQGRPIPKVGDEVSMLAKVSKAQAGSGPAPRITGRLEAEPDGLMVVRVSGIDGGLVRGVKVGDRIPYKGDWHVSSYKNEPLFRGEEKSAEPPPATGRVARMRQDYETAKAAWEKARAEAVKIEAAGDRAATFDAVQKVRELSQEMDSLARSINREPVRRKQVEGMIAAGKPVPPEVLADYPGLAGGGKVPFERAGAPERFAAPWDESKHKRGQPENAGQFGPGGGGHAGAGQAGAQPAAAPHVSLGPDKSAGAAAPSPAAVKAALPPGPDPTEEPEGGASSTGEVKKRLDSLPPVDWKGRPTAGQSAHAGVENFFAGPRPDAAAAVLAAADRQMDASGGPEEDFGPTHGTEATVKIKDLLPTQYVVDKRRIASMADSPEFLNSPDRKDWPLVGRSGGKSYLLNGHNRLASRAVLGHDEARANVVDLDADAERHARPGAPSRFGFDPNEPRIPAGQSGGGEWTAVAPGEDEESQDDWEEGLTADEFDAVEWWAAKHSTCRAFRELDMGAGRERFDSLVLEAYHQFRGAVARAPNYRGRVYRGIHTLERFEAPPGSTITFEAHSSATQDSDIGDGYANMTEEDGKHSVLFKVDATTGADISKINNKGMSEVLIRPGTRFAVQSHETEETENEGGYRIFLHRVHLRELS